MDLAQELTASFGMKKLQAKKFKSAWQELVEEGMDDIARVFRRADKDGSGTVDRGEFRSMLRALCLKFPRAKVERVLDEADEDGDGTFDLGEFRAIIRKLELAPTAEAARNFDDERLRVQERLAAELAAGSST